MNGVLAPAGTRQQCAGAACFILAFLALLVFALMVEAAPRTHEVKPGETLFGIARAELGDGNRWTEIARLNGIGEDARIRVGDRLRLPEEGSEEVGDDPPSRESARTGRRGTTTSGTPGSRIVGDEDDGTIRHDDFDGEASQGQEPVSPAAPASFTAPTPAFPSPRRAASTTPDPWTSAEVSASDPVLASLVARALATSPALHRAAAQVDAASARLRAARSSYLPTVGASERYMNSDNPPAAFMSILQQGRMTPQAQMSMNHPEAVEDWATQLYARALLWDFGRREGSIEAARADERRLDLMRRAAERDVRFSVAQSYFELLDALASVSLWKETVRLFETHERLARTHHEAGTVLRSDLLSVRVALGDARENLVASENGVTIALSRLTASMGAAAPPEIEPRPLGKPAYAAAEEELVRRAREAHPLVAAAGEAEAAGRAMERAARGMSLPSVGVEVNGEWHGDDESFGMQRRSVTSAVVLDIPIFDGWRARAARDEARARQREAAATRAEAADWLEVGARTAHRRANEAVARIEIADDAAEAAREALAIVEERYAAGLARVDELLEVERNLTGARLRALAARTAAWTALAAVERVAGKEAGE